MSAVARIRPASCFVPLDLRQGRMGSPSQTHIISPSIPVTRRCKMAKPQKLSPGFVAFAAPMRNVVQRDHSRPTNPPKRLSTSCA
eukprot:1661407-Amphidinium_carterae.1